MMLTYCRPEVKDYGDLVAITADGSGMAHFGLGTLAAVSAPLLPSGGGSDVAPSSDAGETLGATGGGGDAGGGTAGDTAGLGAGGDGAGGDGAGSLPFTGFLAAGVAALGAGLTAAGAAARKYLGRR